MPLSRLATRSVFRFGPTFVSLLLAAGALPADASDLIFRRERQIFADGTVTDRVEGSPSVTLPDGTTFNVSPRRLTAPDGTAFDVDWEAGQDDEDAPITVVMTVRRAPATGTMREEEARAAYRALHGSDDELARIEAGWHEYETLQPGPAVDPSLSAWIHAAAPDERADILLLVAGDPGIEFPEVPFALSETDPVAVLDAMEERILAIEERRTDVEHMQAPLLERLRAAGAEILGSEWAINGIRARVSASVADRLSVDAQWSLIELMREPNLDSNDGIAVRDAAQVSEFLTAGYDGEASTLRTLIHSDVHVAIVDDRIDVDHPAWCDGASPCNSRLWDVYRKSGTVWGALAPGVQSAYGGADWLNSHGTAVSGILLSDLEDGQDAAVANLTLRADRSGMAPEASFDFVEIPENTGLTDALGQALALNPDVVNMSASLGNEENNVEPDPAWCLLASGANASVNTLYKSDIFVVTTPGNEGSAGTDCRVFSTGTAAGSFTAGLFRVENVANLKLSPLDRATPRGGDPYGRALLDLGAWGRETSNLPDYNNTYKTNALMAGTSAAAPTISGAVADLYHSFAVLGLSSVYADVGNMYATMLLMTDDTYCSGSWPSISCVEAGTNQGPSPLSGMGRLRMRRFDDGGMDAPWRARWCTRTVAHLSVASACLANPSTIGNNVALPLAVDRLKVAAWWYEPNIANGLTAAGTWDYTNGPAQIDLVAYKNGGAYQATGITNPQVHRLHWDTGAGGATWDFRVIGWGVPASQELDYEGGGATRRVHIAMYWEDMARNDADGPNLEID